MKHMLLCVALLLVIPACGTFAAPDPARVQTYQTLGAPLRDEIQRNTAAGVPAGQTLIEVLSALGLLAASIGGSVGAVRLARGPADKAGKVAKALGITQPKA